MYEYDWQRYIQYLIDEIDIGVSFRNSDELSLQYLSDKLGYSIFHTTRKFKELSGISFRDYLRSRKLAFAVADLHDVDRVILEIALDYGFSSHEAFTRAFKGEFGITPGEYRHAAARSSTIPPPPM